MAIGTRALQDSSTGANNTVIGHEAAENITSGARIVAIGTNALGHLLVTPIWSLATRRYSLIAADIATSL